MIVVCQVCGEPYEQRVPLAQFAKTGPGTMEPVDPKPLWFPTCRHKSPMRPEVSE